MEWISVQEKLPDIGQDVLFWATSLQGEYSCKGVRRNEDYWEDKSNCDADGDPDWVGSHRVLFWCEIIPPNNALAGDAAQPSQN